MSQETLESPFFWGDQRPVLLVPEEVVVVVLLRVPKSHLSTPRVGIVLHALLQEEGDGFTSSP